MRKALLLAAASALAAAPLAPAFAQDAPIADASAQGVLVFTPDFFADQRPNTALDMAKRVPGFAVNNGTQARGFEGAVGNVLINGARPASKNDTAETALGRIQASQVERIELIRGGAPGIDMQNYSVVVNVVLTNEASRELVAAIDSFFYDGSHDVPGGSLLYTQRSGERSWSVRIARDPGTNDSNGPWRVLRTDAAGAILRDERSVADSWGGHWAARGSYNGPLAGGVIDLTARYALDDWQEYDTQTGPGLVRDSAGEEDGDSSEFGITWERPLGARNRLETRFINQTASWDGANSYDETIGGVAAPAQVFDYSGKTQETIVRALVRQDRTPALTLEAGAEGAYNMRDTDQLLTVGGAAVPLPSSSVKVEEYRGEAFTRATWRPDPNLSLEGGLRLELSEISQSGGANQKKDFFYPKPRVLVTWTPRPNDQLRFRVERELGQLNFRDFAASADLADATLFGGNVDLAPDSRWIAEAIYERRFWGEGVITLGVRHDEISNAIDYLPLPGGLAAIGNIGDATLDRVSLNLVLPTERLGLRGGRFTFSNDWEDARVTDPTTGLERRMTNSRVSNARIGFEQDIPSWRLRGGLTYLPQYDRPTFNPAQYSTFRLSDYLILFTEYKPDETLSIRGQLTLWDKGLSERVVYADRVAQTVAFQERRFLNANTIFQLTVRKTF